MGAPIHDPVHKISARWIGGAQAASIFVRVTPGLDCVIHVTIGFPSELEHRLQVEVCGRSIEPRFSRDEAGRTLLVAFVPDDLTRLHEGRLWVRSHASMMLGNRSRDGFPGCAFRYRKRTKWRLGWNHW